jgi:hypothetical protein
MRRILRFVSVLIIFPVLHTKKCLSFIGKITLKEKESCLNRTWEANYRFVIQIQTNAHLRSKLK